MGIFLHAALGVKTCENLFCGFRQAEKTGSDESRVLQTRLRPQNTISLRSSAELALTVQLDQSQIHRVTLSPRRAQASSAFDSS